MNWFRKYFENRRYLSVQSAVNIFHFLFGSGCVRRTLITGAIAM